MRDYFKNSNLYWLKYPPDGISIKIRVRPREDIVIFPKFKEFVSESGSPQILNERNVEEYTISWQEKKLSRFEIENYASSTCNTDIDLQYHNVIENKDYDQCKIFTYTHTDSNMPMHALKQHKKNISSPQNILNLELCFTKFNLCEKFGSDISQDVFSSTKRLFKSEEDVSSEQEHWISMCILWDNSEYNEDSHLLFKDECLLVSLHYNKLKNHLIVSPDVNDLEYNAYNIESSTGTLGLEYAFEIDFGDNESTGELDVLLNKLKGKLEKKHKSQLGFSMPPLGKLRMYITFEIVSAIGFDMDNIYIDFNMKISDAIKCNGNTSGRTHISSALKTNGRREWYFGHIVDLVFECYTSVDPPLPKMFFEAISTDWWGRHRTEGYACLTLPLAPGHHTKQLSCSRPEEIDCVEAENRRFFIGGCHLIKDLDVIENPQLYKTNFRFTSTGNVLVRWNAIRQAHTPGSIPSVVNASGTELLRRADDVLRNYHKAKATLAAVTKDLAPTDGSGEI